jgi:hypothetical protein
LEEWRKYSKNRGKKWKCEKCQFIEIQQKDSPFDPIEKMDRIREIIQENKDDLET